jgi:hypothetical protein
MSVFFALMYVFEVLGQEHLICLQSIMAGDSSEILLQQRQNLKKIKIVSDKLNIGYSGPESRIHRAGVSYQFQKK